MPKIDDIIYKIDKVICRHLDEIEGSTRGAISQDILEQLLKFVNQILIKFYASGQDIAFSEELLQRAVEYAQVTSSLNSLYRFRKFLQVVTIQYTLDEDGSERLMLKYYRYLLEIKKLLRDSFSMHVLYNLHKFPLRQDNTLQEYYTKISERIEQHPAHFGVKENEKYYIQKIKPIFVKAKEYFEITFTPVDDSRSQSKTSRVIAFTRLPVSNCYASKFHIINETIEILGKTMPILIIDGWEVSIRDCEFRNFISLVTGRRTYVPYAEQKLICRFLTQTQFTLTEVVEFPDSYFDKKIAEWKSELKSSVFIPVIERCREIIRKKMAGQNILRYLLYCMNNVIIKKQRKNDRNENLSNLYMQNGCIQFDKMPFNRSPMGHNPRSGALFECIPCENRQPELFARMIRNNTEGKGTLFTDVKGITGYKDIKELITMYNNSIWYKHRPESNLMLEHDHVFINQYRIDTCTIIQRLQELAQQGIGNYSFNVDNWLHYGEYNIDCDEKKRILRSIFADSHVGVIYGSAGVGKSTMINHVSHFFDEYHKLYLTQTNPAKENLIRKIDAKNTCFSTIASFLNQKSECAEYQLLVIDECSTVSNQDMVAVLKKARFNMLLLVGDTYQIDAIKFGNWFSVLRTFLPDSAVFELTKPHRTNNPILLELWDKVRYMADDVKEIIEKESSSLKVDDSLLSSVGDDEAILCLNYDGLYGINNINRFLQESNPNPAVQWGVQRYKVGDPILFLDSDRFYPEIHNNMKGTIRGISIVNSGNPDEFISFDVEIPKVIYSNNGCDFRVIWYSEEEETSLIRFIVHKLKSADEDVDDSVNDTTIPFQIAYAVSIHKAQGLEYNSVKIVVTDEVEELVTHNIFYTAITRAREKLKIYWTPETEEKVLNRIRPKDISKDVELLKIYLE